MSNKKKIAILQSNYIPWKGYFDLINMVDEFVIFDSVQYTRRDWRNRNKILTPFGSKWLSIPIDVKGKYFQKICETRISDIGWGEKHWNIIKHNYRKAPYFLEYAPIFKELYLENHEELLSRINFNFIEAVNNLLGIETIITWSDDFNLLPGKSECLLGICETSAADVYVSGPSAKGYLDTKIFVEANIKVEWMDYNNYPLYNQMFALPFEHSVTILDLIFNEGGNASKYMKSFGS